MPIVWFGSGKVGEAWLVFSQGYGRAIHGRKMNPELRDNIQPVRKWNPGRSGKWFRRE